MFQILDTSITPPNFGEFSEREISSFAFGNTDDHQVDLEVSFSNFSMVSQEKISVRPLRISHTG